MAWPLEELPRNGTHALLGQHFPDAAIEDRHHLVDLIGGDHKRWTEGQPMRVEASEQSIFQCPPTDPLADWGVEATF